MMRGAVAAVPAVSARTPIDRQPSFELQFRVVHGYRRAFVCVGQGPALLLIHGIGDSSATWSQLIPTLARDHTVIAPDLLGHGASDKPRADYAVAAYANGMRDLLSILGIERASIVGHSLGGGIAMQLAYQYPERCERLVLVSTGGVSRDVHPFLRLAAAPPAGLALPLLNLRATQVAVRGTLHLMRRLKTDIGRDADDFVRVFDALPDWSSRRAFLRTVRAAVDWHGQHVTMLDRAYLAADLPTMIVWGRYDGVVPYRHALVAHAALPGSRLETFDDAGHFPHHTDPARFLRILTDFCATTPPAAFNVERWRALLRRGPAHASDTSSIRVSSAPGPTRIGGPQ
jgi:pimeloyl-ACP methyl ester carboxylesterase